MTTQSCSLLSDSLIWKANGSTKNKLKMDATSERLINTNGWEGSLLTLQGTHTVAPTALSYFVQSSFSAAYSAGIWAAASPAQDFYYTKIGTLVILQLTAYTAVSNAAATYTVTVPAELTAAADALALIQVNDDTTLQTGLASISGTTVTISATAAGGNFTGGGAASGISTDGILIYRTA